MTESINDKFDRLTVTVLKVKSDRDTLLEAVREIEKGEGAFSCDQLTHAENTIENMKRIAREAREKVEWQS